MDIKLPFLNLTPPALTLSGLAGLNLKVGQPLDAKVISTLINTTQNAIVLKLGNQAVTLQTSQPLNMQPGQNLAIQVAQVTPSLEFKLLSPLPGITSQPILLTLLPQTAATKPQLQAKVIGLTGNQIQLQILPETSPNTQSKPITIYLDKQQTGLPNAISVGQQVVLETIGSEKKTEYKLVAIADDRIETKLATLITQLLPKQASAVVVLEQLRQDLPRLISNDALPQSLKGVVLDILQNLPQKEHLFDSQNLAKLLSNSGIFLEAKLPLLIKSGLLTDNLKEFAINLLQKLPQQAIPKSINIEPKTIGPADNLPEILLNTDLKANLGKLLLALNLEINSRNDLLTGNADIDLMKNLQQKVESSLAKIVMEQLSSLPKEDSPKQIWQCDIAFLDREKTQTAQFEIHLDKEQNPSTEDKDWSVTITITPPGLGSIHCVVVCRNELISTYFKTQQTETASLIKDNLDHLKSQFEDQGLKVGQMTANEGGLQRKSGTVPTQGKKLFDDHA